MRRLLYISLMAACLSPLSACDEYSNASIYVTARAAGGGSCEYEAGDTGLIQGYYAVDDGHPYVFVASMANALIPRASSTRAEPNHVTIQGAEIELRGLDGEPLVFSAGVPNPFSVPATGFLPVGMGGGAVGQSVVAFTAIPERYRQELTNLFPSDGSIVLAVRPFGVTTGDVDVTSDFFQFPVDILRAQAPNQSGLTRCIPPRMDGMPPSMVGGDDAVAEICEPGQDRLTYIICDEDADEDEE